MWFMVCASLLVVVSAEAVAAPWAVCCFGAETGRLELGTLSRRARDARSEGWRGMEGFIS